MGAALDLTEALIGRVLGQNSSVADELTVYTDHPTLAAVGTVSVPAAVEVAAFRIAQEVMTDAIRHSGAEHVTVRLDGRPGTLFVEVADDGRGCPDDAPPGLGLRSMRDRATELGGTCRVESAPGGGTRVSATLPRGGHR